jgi:RNA polymerase sigma-70 factor (ECF subfamily)
MDLKALLSSGLRRDGRSRSQLARGHRPSDVGRVASTGDNDALEGLLRAIAPDMLRVIRAVVGASCPDVENLMQEALIDFVRALGQFPREGGLMTVALTLAFRRAFALKCRQRDLARRIDSSPPRHERRRAPPSSAAQGPLMERRRTLVVELLTAIPRAEANVLGLRAVVGLSIEQIALATDVPARTVRSLLRLAKEGLRKAIEADTDLREFLG